MGAVGSTSAPSVVQIRLLRSDEEINSRRTIQLCGTLVNDSQCGVGLCPSWSQLATHESALRFMEQSKESGNPRPWCRFFPAGEYSRRSRPDGRWRL